MEKIKANGHIAVGNRASEPLFALSSRVVHSDKFWRWGEDNLLPYALSLMSRRSTTHRRIINDKADYIAGKGFSCDERQTLLRSIIEQANGDGESLRSILFRLAFDKALMGNAFLEVVTDEHHSFLSFYHQDASQCRVDRDKHHIILHHDWREYRSEQARRLPLYPAFEKQEDGSLRSILHYKDYEPMFNHYGVPKYIAGMGVSAIAYKTDCWNIARLDNSFQLSGVMILDGSTTDAEAEQIARSAQRHFAGNPGAVMFVVRDGKGEDASRFIPIEAHNEGDWSQLHDQAISDIVIAHSWFRSLSGLDYSAGFNSERILHEYEVALNTVILAEQAELLSPIKAVVESLLGISCASLEIINRPPTRSKPIYMKVWEARKADGLDYDEQDPAQQAFLSQITKYNVTAIN